MGSEIVAYMLELRPAALVTVLISLVAFIITSLRLRKLQVKREGMLGVRLLVGLNGRSLIHLAVCWVKFAFFAAALLAAQPVKSVHGLLLGVLLIIALLLGVSLRALINEVLSGAIIAGGLALSRFLLNYLLQIKNDPNIRAAYWLLAAFLIVCAAVIFVRECQTISGERNYFDETDNND